jgi:hypothetical protein
MRMFTNVPTPQQIQIAFELRHIDPIFGGSRDSEKLDAIRIGIRIHEDLDLIHELLAPLGERTVVLPKLFL